MLHNKEVVAFSKEAEIKKKVRKKDHKKSKGMSIVSNKRGGVVSLAC